MAARHFNINGQRVSLHAGPVATTGEDRGTCEICIESPGMLQYFQTTWELDLNTYEPEISYPDDLHARVTARIPFLDKAQSEALYEAICASTRYSMLMFYLVSSAESERQQEVV